jgi:hypothetical protein
MFYSTTQRKFFPICFRYHNEFFSGNEFPAVVEFAPFQKVPKKKTKKADSKKGTIEQGTKEL